MEKSFHMIKKPTLIKVLFDSVGQSFRFLKQNQLSLESSMIVAVKQFKCEINNQLCKPSYSNCHLEMGVCKWDSTPLHFWCTTSRPTTKEVRFCLHIKDFKWGRKCIFINCISCNGSPQQNYFSLQIENCPIPVAEHSGHGLLLEARILRKIFIFNCINKVLFIFHF